MSAFGMSVVIAEERPDSPDAVALIGELDDHLGALYASESRHGFSVEKLLRDGVKFFVARDGGRPAGCGLYEARGFRKIPPFGPYRDDPVSLCYELRLSS